jgi:hypothetical protein
VDADRESAPRRGRPRVQCSRDELARRQQRTGEQGGDDGHGKLEEQPDDEGRLEHHVDRKIARGNKTFDVLLDCEPTRRHEAEQPYGQGTAQTPVPCLQDDADQTDEDKRHVQAHGEVGERQTAVAALLQEPACSSPSAATAR